MRKLFSLSASLVYEETLKEFIRADGDIFVNYASGREMKWWIDGSYLNINEKGI